MSAAGTGGGPNGTSPAMAPGTPSTWWWAATLIPVLAWLGLVGAAIIAVAVSSSPPDWLVAYTNGSVFNVVNYVLGLALMAALVSRKGPCPSCGTNLHFFGRQARTCPSCHHKIQCRSGRLVIG